MIEENDRILLCGRKREYFVTAGEGRFSTDKGILELSELVGKNAGDEIKTHLGDPFRIMIPRPTDFFSYAKRTGAPMLPKDIGLVIAYTGMNHKDRVLDAGTGSAIAAIYFGGIAESVVTWEQREEFASVCRKNINDAGLCNVEVKTGDVLEEKGVFDIVHHDLTITPEHIVHAFECLKPGGYLAAYTPFLEHTFTVIDTAEDLFTEVVCHETIGRELTRTKRGTRPSTRVCHSGYITVCRK